MIVGSVSVIVGCPPSGAVVAAILIWAASPEQVVPHVTSVVSFWMPVVLVYLDLIADELIVVVVDSWIDVVTVAIVGAQSVSCLCVNVAKVIFVFLSGSFVAEQLVVVKVVAVFVVWVLCQTRDPRYGRRQKVLGIHCPVIGANLHSIDAIVHHPMHQNVFASFRVMYSRDFPIPLTVVGANYHHHLFGLTSHPCPICRHPAVVVCMVFCHPLVFLLGKAIHA